MREPYVGNLTSGVTETHIRELFQTVGRVLFVKINGNPANTYRYGFVEFADISTAHAALALNGTHVGHDNIRVGKADNPIFKSGATQSAAANPVKLMEALKRVQIAKAALLKKYSSGAGATKSAAPDNNTREAALKRSHGDERRKRARERRGFNTHKPSRRRHRRKYSRSRSRSRSRERRRRRSRSRSRERRERRDRSKRAFSPPPKEKKEKKETATRNGEEQGKKPTGQSYYLSNENSKRGAGTNLVWDGFQWHTPGKEEGTDFRCKRNDYASASSTGGSRPPLKGLTQDIEMAAQAAIKAQKLRFGM